MTDVFLLLLQCPILLSFFSLTLILSFTYTYILSTFFLSLSALFFMSLFIPTSVIVWLQQRDAEGMDGTELYESNNA